MLWTRDGTEEHEESIVQEGRGSKAGWVARKGHLSKEASIIFRDVPLIGSVLDLRRFQDQRNNARRVVDGRRHRWTTQKYRRHDLERVHGMLLVIRDNRRYGLSTRQYQQ